jgi:isopenicillin N synthase-like dioxygenase
VCDEFEPTFTSFFLSCYRAELVILEAISIGLGLTSQALSELHATQSNELRLTHYPAVSREEFSHSTRIAAHTDFGTITLLFQDSVGGLQVELPRGSGNFLDLESGGLHECILNVGDCLQSWTNLPSARHRVHLPDNPRISLKLEAESIIDERFSIAYFGKPDRKASLRPLVKALELKDANPQYITAGEFQNMRIEGTYA